QTYTTCMGVSSARHSTSYSYLGMARALSEAGKRVGQRLEQFDSGTSRSVACTPVEERARRPASARWASRRFQHPSRKLRAGRDGYCDAAAFIFISIVA